MHYSVMLNEVVKLINLKEDGIYVDATLGYGGHSSRILERIKTGHLFAFDQDIEAIRASQERLHDLAVVSEIKIILPE